jgi:hypothetical protein
MSSLTYGCVTLSAEHETENPYASNGLPDPQDVRMTVPGVPDKPQAFPEWLASRSGIHSYHTIRSTRLGQQVLGDCSRYPGSAGRFCDIEPAHAQGAGKRGIDREAADPGEVGIDPSCEERFAVLVKAQPVGVPFLGEPIQMPITFALGFHAKRVKPGGQLGDDPFELRQISSVF